MKVEIDSQRQTITVDGVVISLELLRCFANPDPAKLYQFVRKDDCVTVQTFRVN